MVGPSSDIQFDREAVACRMGLLLACPLRVPEEASLCAARVIRRVGGPLAPRLLGAPLGMAWGSARVAASARDGMEAARFAPVLRT